MSFLSIAFLAALPLAAAPLLLHLFDRRRHVVIEWGAMQFLVEAASRKTSARKLKQWLLLLLATLAVAALVLALARPLAPGNWLEGAEQTETILIVDNSMSMLRSAGESTLLDQATARAIDDVQGLPPGDYLRVLLASPYPTWMTAGSVRVDANSQSDLETQLRQLRPTGGRSDLLSALFTAVQTELQPTQKERRIVLLTDGQRSDWSLDDAAAWSRFREVLMAAPIPTQLEIATLDGSGRDAANLAVHGVRSSRLVAGINQPFTLTAHVQNYGSAASSTCEAKWLIGDREAHESHVPRLDGGAEHDLQWRHSFSEPGVYAISCRLDADDLLPYDNRATVVVEVVNQAPVLLVESAAGQAEVQQDSFFVQAALGWIDGEPLDEKAIYVPTLASPERLAQIDLSGYRAVVIPNYTDLEKEVVEQLQQFVFDGGGLWIALGPRTDAEAFNQLLFADGNGISPLAIDRIVEEQKPSQVGPEGAASKTAINPFVKDHPALTELANPEQLDLGEVAISRRFRFTPPPQGEDASILLSLTNGEPLAAEKYVGRGRVIVQAIPLRMQWSDLARSQAFVVLAQNWLDYLTQPRATRHNLQPGDAIAMHVADAESRQATLRTPHGDEIELAADAEGEGLVFRSSRTILPGDYWLDLGLSGDSIPFHVNRDPRESQLEPLTAADHERLAEVAGLARNVAKDSSGGSSQSDPLWPMLLMVLIGLIAAELLLSGLISRERFGSEPIAETTDPWSRGGVGPLSMSDSPPTPAELPGSFQHDREMQAT